MHREFRHLHSNLDIAHSRKLDRFSTIPFLSIMLRPFPHSPISHTSKADPPVVGTGTRPNGKKRKRGRGRGEEEEADAEKMQDIGGYEIVLQPARTEEIDTVTWWMWEGQ